MADDVKEFSREEAQGLMFNGAPQQAPMQAIPLTGPAIPPSVGKVDGLTKGGPVAKKIDAFPLVEKVGAANKKLQEQMVKPEAPSAIHELVDQISSNWKPLGIGALGVATAYGAARLLGGKKPIESLEGKPLTGKGPTQRIEPTFATPEETAVFKPVEQPIGPSQLAVEAQAKFGVPLSDVENHFGVKVTNIKDAEILSNNYKNSLSGAISNAPAGIPSGVNPMNALTGGTTAPVQPPAAPPMAPSIGQTVATGGNVDQAIKQTVANLVDQPTPVAPPKGMKPQYKPKKGEIGPGGYNWFASQVGPEEAAARWEQQYGKKNVPYNQVQSEYAATRYPVKPNPEGAKTGGAFGKPENIPDYIKGGASMGAMLNVAGNALGILGLGQEYKKAKKSGDWSDFGMGVANQIVGNIAPRLALPLALMTPGSTNAGEQEELARRRQMAPTISGGIAPPSFR